MDFGFNQSILFVISLVLLFLIFVFLSWRVLRKIMPKEPQTGDYTMDELIDKAGYAYDSGQDIFYSKQNPWQRKFGYCRLYDEAAAPAGMIIDCEPILFDYDGKRWLIQLWKGQYYLNTGAEIGVYVAKTPDLSVPGVFNGTFYRSASNRERLYLSYSLMKNDVEVFRRHDKHWWLTGFRLGEFSEPDELSMKIRIVFRDDRMRDAFIDGLKKIGYREPEIMRNGFAVGFVFHKTHTMQPLTRTEETDWLIQRNNQRLCRRYQEITAPYNSWPEKLEAIRVREPFLYQAVLTIGKTGQIFSVYEKIRGEAL